SGNKTDTPRVDTWAGDTYPPGVKTAVPRFGDSGQPERMRAVASNAEASMAKISRRNVIAGAAVAPLALNGAAHAAPEKPGREVRTAPTSKPDPVVAKAASWIAAYDAREALIWEWQHQETALFAKVKAL